VKPTARHRKSSIYKSAFFVELVFSALKAGTCPGLKKWQKEIVVLLNFSFRPRAGIFSR
jgi:hypothetical protein